MIYLRDTSQKMGDASRSTLLNLSVEEVHNCPAVRDVSSIAYKDTKETQENEGASEQTWFRPNLSIFPPLICFFSLFFFTTDFFFT